MFWGNTVNLVASRHTVDLSTFPGMSLIFDGSTKETRPLILRTTTKEEIRLQKIGNRERRAEKERKRIRKMGNEEGGA